MSIILFPSQKLFSQDYSLSDPYSEKILFNPAYSGLGECYEINMNFNTNLYIDQLAFSINNHFEKYKSGLGLLVTNNIHGKGAINNFSVAGIYSYKIDLNEKTYINSALQINYFQQSINPQKLIFSDQIDPISGTVNSSSAETSFIPINTYDFSIGSTMITNQFRTGFALHHIDKLFQNKLNLFNPKLSVYFGKVFSIKNIGTNQINFLIPELIYNFQNNFHQLIYSFHLINNNFLTRVYLKHNLGFNSLAGAFTLGLNYKNIRLSYTYEINFTRYISIPISSNQISLKFNLFCKEKRNKKNTIYCAYF